MHKIYHTIIIGGGPAGLAAASSLASHYCNDFLILERGKPLSARQRQVTEDVPSGVGGAGLYSDGKFSFFPSSSWMWNHLSFDYLEKSYDWLNEVLQRYGVIAPDLKNRSTCETLPLQNFKAYDSFYMNFNDRYAMTEEWSNSFSSKILTQIIVLNIAKNNNHYHILTTKGSFFAENIILATGRMGPLQIPSYSLSIQQKFQRIEVGVRIKGPYTHPFFSELQKHGQYIDPKYIFANSKFPDVSWRTFCFCKRGEIMDSGNDDYIALSGRADCLPTDESNIGFNTRIKIESIKNKLPKSSKSFTLKLSEANQNHLSQYFDTEVANYISLGFIELKNHFSSLVSDDILEITGPTIEGVGDYPAVNTQLKTNQPNIYIAGDAIGLFRGLTAALLSGHYIAQQILAKSEYSVDAVNL